MHYGSGNGSYSEREVLARLFGRGGELQLQRRGPHFEIIYNGVFLMADYNGNSERAAVKRALALLTADLGPGEAAVWRVLLGGLGMGFSLQEALADRRTAAVTVAEIEPSVIEWNRTYFAELNGNALADPRVTVFNEPFERLLEREAAKTGEYDQRTVPAPPAWHLVMVDTDNGSTWLSRLENAAIYDAGGLSLIRRCLAPGGYAAFWCAACEPQFEKALRRLFRSPLLYEALAERTGQEAGFYLIKKLDAAEAEEV